VTANFKK